MLFSPVFYIDVKLYRKHFIYIYLQVVCKQRELNFFLGVCKQYNINVLGVNEQYKVNLILSVLKCEIYRYS